MPKSKARKNLDENFKVAAVQRLQPAAYWRTTSPNCAVVRSTYAAIPFEPCRIEV